MLELYFLLFHVPRRVCRLARPRGESVVKWAIAASGAWIGMEALFFAAFILALYVTEAALTGWMIVLDIAALYAGMRASDRVLRKLESLPVIAPPPDFAGTDKAPGAPRS